MVKICGRDDWWAELELGNDKVRGQIKVVRARRTTWLKDLIMSELHF